MKRAKTSVVGRGGGDCFDDGAGALLGCGPGHVFGILDVNGWHNVVHIATGALGLAAFAAGAYAARTYAFGLGVVYLVVAIWGFVIGSGDSILSIIPINTEDSVLHLALGVTGLLAGLASAAPRAEPEIRTGLAA